MIDGMSRVAAAVLWAVGETRQGRTGLVAAAAAELVGHPAASSVSAAGTWLGSALGPAHALTVRSRHFAFGGSQSTFHR